MIHVLGPKDPPHKDAILTVSRSTTWSKGLSPFMLGPISCYDGLSAKNMENAWQFAKLYAPHADSEGKPTDLYFQWRDYGWALDRAIRYPAGKGAKALCHIWGGKRYNYVKARYAIYIPCYAKAVVRSEAFATLKDLYQKRGELWLWDFDGYDHLSMNRSYREVFDDPNKKAGHAFVIAMLLQNIIDENGEFLDEKEGEPPVSGEREDIGAIGQ
jgi:hypothetical protein